MIVIKIRNTTGFFQFSLQTLTVFYALTDHFF